MHDAIARARGSDTNRHVNVDHLRGHVRERQVGDDVLFALTKVIADRFERGLGRPCGIVVRDHHRFRIASGTRSVDQCCAMTWFLITHTFFDLFLGDFLAQRQETFPIVHFGEFFVFVDAFGHGVAVVDHVSLDRKSVV